MKKLMMLLAFFSLTSATFAADETTESYPTKKHGFVSNRFWDNWFIDAGVTHLSFYGDQEQGLSPKPNKNPFWPGRRSWGGEISIGKWATPAFGMRLKGQFAWGTQVNMDWSAPTYVSNSNPTFNQFNISLQPMVNLNNLFCGYKPRVWNISVYGGFGFMYNTDEKNSSMMFTAGVFNTFNVTKRFHINLDIYADYANEYVDGREGGVGGKKVLRCGDLPFGVSAGVGVNLGKVGWDKAPDMDAILANHKSQIDALNASIAGLEAENAALKDALAKKPKEVVKEVVKTVGEFETTSASVFFNINKSVIASKKDLVNVRELAEVAKKNNKKIVVTGYADSKTGSPAYNKTLSERRAETVKKALIDMGVDAANIETVGQGGVADLTPYSYNRRAVVTLK
jgi:outer membrane protein OmpA-like peptidoglycan-associated protein